MKVVQTVIRQCAALAYELGALAAIQPNLVLAFGSVALLLRDTRPAGAGVPQLCARRLLDRRRNSNHGVEDGTLVVTALRFAHARAKSPPAPPCPIWMIPALPVSGWRAHCP